MPTQVYESEPSCLLGEVGKLIADEAKNAIDRMIALASGELAPALVNNAERPTPNADAPLPNTQDQIPNTDAVVLPVAQSPGPPVRVYLKRPHIFSIEYIINAALGTPGADIDCYETTIAESERLQGAKCPELNIDNADLLTSCDQQLKDALPIAIERLFELAAGITLQRTRYGKPYTITCKPNGRAIEYIADRVAGKSTSVIGELRTRFQYAAATQNQQPENSPFPARDERIGEGGRGVRQEVDGPHESGAGAEGFVAAGFGKTDRGEGGTDSVPVPVPVPDPLSYITTANKKLADFLPIAIGHMKSLARGAQVIIETDSERRVFHHEPDARANAFLINRFRGAPTNYLQIEQIVEKSALQIEIERLSALYPDVIAHYGTAEAAIAAYHAKYGGN